MKKKGEKEEKKKDEPPFIRWLDLSLVLLDSIVIKYLSISRPEVECTTPERDQLDANVGQEPSSLSMLPAVHIGALVPIHLRRSFLRCRSWSIADE